MALPDFAECGPADTDVADVQAGTLTSRCRCTLQRNGQGLTVNLITAPFLASGGVAAANSAVIDAAVAAFATQFGGASLLRTRVAYFPKTLGS